MQVALSKTSAFTERVQKLDFDLQRLAVGAERDLLIKINDYRQVLQMTEVVGGLTPEVEIIETFLSRFWWLRYNRERRVFKRTETHIDVTATLSDASMIMGTVVNVSSGGACFKVSGGYVDGMLFGDLAFAADVLRVGDVVQIQFDGDVALCAVRWVDGQYVGLQFAKEIGA